jgi:hypothetical protein
MNVVNIITGRPVHVPSIAAMERTRVEIAANTSRLDEFRRRDRERKRAWRFLKRGGVILREEIGGAVGVRWSKPSRSGAFDAATCERWLQRGRLVADATLANGFTWRDQTSPSEEPL